MDDHCKAHDEIPIESFSSWKIFSKFLQNKNLKTEYLVLFPNDTNDVEQVNLSVPRINQSVMFSDFAFKYLLVSYNRAKLLREKQIGDVLPSKKCCDKYK